MKLRLMTPLALLVFLALPSMGVRAQTVRTSVLPSVTDPKIDRFNTEHVIYRNFSAKSRHELLVFLPGTNGNARGARLFCTTAADLGYHVINLMYPDDLSATACWNDEDKDAFTKFRLAIIEGKESPHVAINRANSIENRLIKLLAYLKANRPSEEWGQFLQATKDKGDQPVWEHIALAGQSQGGGHAALIACQHKVARVLMFSSPKDWSRRYDKPASWYKPSQTPASRYFAFVHEQDRQGCSWEQQREIFKAMGLTGSYNVDKSADKNVKTAKVPYDKSRVLTTNYPGTRVTSQVAHSTEIGDGITPKDDKGVPLFKPVWEYMLTAN